MVVRIRTLVGDRRHRITVSRRGDGLWCAAGLRPPVVDQLARIRTAVSTNSLPLPFGGVMIEVMPAVGSCPAALDLPIALALMALAEDGSIGCDVTAIGHLQVDGRCVIRSADDIRVVPSWIGRFKLRAGRPDPYLCVPVDHLVEARTVTTALSREAVR